MRSLIKNIPQAATLMDKQPPMGGHLYIFQNDSNKSTPYEWPTLSDHHFSNVSSVDAHIWFLCYQ